MWRDPQLLATARKVKIYVDPEAKADKVNASRIGVKLVDGRYLEAYHPYRKGRRENPLRDEEIKEKARGLISRVLSAEAAEEIIAMTDRLPDLADVAPLLRRTQPLLT